MNVKRGRGKNYFTLLILTILLSSFSVLGLSGCASSYSEGAETGNSYYTEGSYMEEFSLDQSVASDSAELDATSTTDLPTAELPATEQKWITTQSLSMETTDFDATIESIEALAKENGGHIEQSQVNGSEELNNRNASYTIRIPADVLETFSDQIQGLATVTYTSTNATDVTLSYVDTQSYLESLRTEQETLLDILDNATEVADVIAIQSQLTQVRYMINSYESQLRVMDDQISYSTMYLDLAEVDRESEVGDGSFWEDVGQNLSENWYVFSQLVRAFGVMLFSMIPFWIPLIVIVLLVVFIVRLISNRKNHRKNKGKSNGKDEAHQENQTEENKGN
ncbi:MAG: DUF4349 domain-containing protein [Lachnospiraceae bacterium]